MQQIRKLSVLESFSYLFTNSRRYSQKIRKKETVFGTTVRKCLKSFHFLLTNDVFCDSVSEEQKTKSKIQLLFSYSEWWRYIGSVKPRQPPDRMVCTGRCQPERNFRTIRGFEHYYSGPLRLRIFFIVQRSYRRSKEKRRKKGEREWKKDCLLLSL